MQLLSFHSFLPSCEFPFFLPSMGQFFSNTPSMGGSFRVGCVNPCFDKRTKLCHPTIQTQTFPTMILLAKHSQTSGVFPHFRFRPRSTHDFNVVRAKRANERSPARSTFSAHKKVRRFCRPRPTERGSKEGRGIGFVPRI